MDNEEQTLDSNPGDELIDAASSEGVENVDTVPTATPALTLDEINSLTGHRYQTIDEAKKGLDNLKRAVGKKEIVKEVVPSSLAEEVNQLKAQVAESNFYTEHPDLKPVKDVISKFGPNPYEAVKDPVVQKVIDAVKAREDSESLKSTPKINQVSADYQSDFETAQATGNWAEFLAKHKGVRPK